MVEWKKLSEVCGVYDGTHQTPKYTDTGVRFVSVENIDAPYKSNKYISQIDYEINYKTKPQKGDVLMTRIGDVGTCTVLNLEEPIAYYVSLALIRPNSKLIQSNYVKYILESNIGKRELRKRTLLAAVPLKINLGDVGKIQIPIPSLSEQQRIVGILDTFTASIDNLKEQIAQRRKQYEYYRDQLYYASKEELIKAAKEGLIEVKTFDEIGTFTRGRRFVRTDIVQEGVPCIHYGDMYTYYGISADTTPTHLTQEVAAKLRYASKDDVVIVAAGENDLDIGIGVAWLGEDDVVVHDACFIFKHDMDSKYISHYLRSRNYHQQIRMGVVDGKICSISAKELGRTLIPIPSLQEQSRIVGILDTFEASIQNLEAQLKEREKQYDYYRNKLLTFE